MEPYAVGSPLVVRVAGLPASALARLRSPDTLTAVHAILDAERQLRADGAALADALHGVISVLADPDAKPGLVGLRRALFAGRRPRAAEWSPAVRTALSAGCHAAIERWLGALAGRDALVEALDATVERETARTVRLLLDTAAHPVLRHGIAQSSPALSGELEKWLARGGTPTRQVVARLARYVSRAAAKTSPYSTFTTIGAGHWSPAIAATGAVTGDATGAVTAAATGDVTANPPAAVTGNVPGDLTSAVPDDMTAGRAADRTAAAACGLLEFHGVVLHRLEVALLGCPVLRRALAVRVNPSATLADGRLTVLGPPPAEAITSVAAVPEVRACLRVLGTGRSTYGGLLAALTSGNGVPDTGRVTVFLDRLVEIGLLELRLPVDDQSTDRFGVLAGWLRAHGGERWARTADRCAQLSALLCEPTDLADVHAHRRRLRAIRHAADGLREDAGLPEEADAGVAADLVHEHVVHPRPVVAASLPAWRGVLDDLEAVRRWMALHDPGLALRVALGAFCGEAFGPGASVPFVRFHRALLAAVADPARGSAAVYDLGEQLRPRPSTVDSRLDALRELERLRGKALDELFGSPVDPDGVIRVRPQRLAAAAEGLPPAVRPAASVAWYLQPVGIQHAVLNQAIGGHGRARGRLLHLVNRAGGEPPQSPGAALRGRIVADSSGTFGHPMNLRAPVGGHELDYPFTYHDGVRPAVPLRELVVRHDPATGLVALHTAAGDEVTPAHTGMMSEYLLPAGLQLLIRGFGTVPTLFQPARLLTPPPLAGQVCHAPRIEVGRVVLRRATWTVPPELVPRRAAGERDGRFLLRLHAWLAEHGIPERCFVLVSAPVLPGQTWLDAAFTKARKPLYVDLSSPVQVGEFERLTSRPAQRVTFREALPALESHGGAHVAEFVIEITAGAP